MRVIPSVHEDERRTGQVGSEADALEGPEGCDVSDAGADARCGQSDEPGRGAAVGGDVPRTQGADGDAVDACYIAPPRQVALTHTGAAR